VRRDRTSCWRGEKWVLAQEKEGDEGSESRDERMVMVKLIV
jgi:hypothetical protein